MKWEYEVVIADQMTGAQLNSLGSAGWEHYGIDGIQHYFKRPMQEKSVKAAPAPATPLAPAKSTVKKAKK